MFVCVCVGSGLLVSSAQRSHLLFMFAPWLGCPPTVKLPRARVGIFRPHPSGPSISTST